MAEEPALYICSPQGRCAYPECLNTCRSLLPSGRQRGLACGHCIMSALGERIVQNLQVGWLTGIFCNSKQASVPSGPLKDMGTHISGISHRRNSTCLIVIRMLADRHDHIRFLHAYAGSSQKAFPEYAPGCDMGLACDQRAHPVALP